MLVFRLNLFYILVIIGLYTCIVSSKDMLGDKADILTIGDTLRGKRVLVRVDYNVPLDGVKITDDNRIMASLPTLTHILAQSPKSVVLMSHLGRPDGSRKMEYSLAPVASYLADKLGKPVKMLDDCVGEAVEKEVLASDNGAIFMLENLRFHIAEEGKGVDANGAKVKATASETEAFRASLSKLGDVFVNDAFGTAHRAHSSMVGINLPVRVSGLLMKKELDYFADLLENPEHPVLAILGGAKVADKLPLIKNLLPLVDMMIIGGGMAFTFLKELENMKIGASLYDPVGAKEVASIMEMADKANVKIFLPVDFRCADKANMDAEPLLVTKKEGVPDNFMGMDCGPETQKMSSEAIKKAKMVLWNGPQGVFEKPAYAKGSLSVLDDLVAQGASNGLISVAGGGDTAALVAQAGKAHLMSHVSTGGGASLELLEGKDLPGVSALSTK